MKILALGTVLVLLALWLARELLGQARATARARPAFQALGQDLGLEWKPPKSADDLVSPGALTGRIDGRKVRIEASRPTGMRRHELGDALVRAAFARSLDMGAHAGSGELRARSPGSMSLADAALARRLRPKARDEAALRALLDHPDVAGALNALGEQFKGVGFDDGMLSVAVRIGGEVETLRSALAAVTAAAATIDAARDA